MWGMHKAHSVAVLPTFPPSSAVPSAEAPLSEPETVALCRQALGRIGQVGLTQELARVLLKIGPHGLLVLDDPTERSRFASLLALAATANGRDSMAASVLDAKIDTPSPALRLLDVAARLYQACVLAQHAPDQPARWINHLTDELVTTEAQTDEATREARAYAALVLAEALLRLGDVGAARQQLQSITDDAGLPPALALLAGCLLVAIEQAVGRPDLGLRHLDSVAARAGQLAPQAGEGMLVALTRIGLLFAQRPAEGQAALDALRSSPECPPLGLNTVGRLARLFVQCTNMEAAATNFSEGVAAGDTPQSVELRQQARDDLAWLHQRHRSAGASLLCTGLYAGVLLSLHDLPEAYRVLVEAAADMRCRYLDGVADLCDRQILVLQHRLGPDTFERVLNEAQRRRQTPTPRPPRPTSGPR